MEFHVQSVEDSMIDREKKIVLEELNSRELHPGNKTHKYVMNKIFSDRKNTSIKLFELLK
jgi:hypothetical protein